MTYLQHCFDIVNVSTLASVRERRTVFAVDVVCKALIRLVHTIDLELCCLGSMYIHLNHDIVLVLKKKNCYKTKQHELMFTT